MLSFCTVPFLCFIYIICVYVLRTGKRRDQIGPARTAIAGGLAGIVLWTSVFPFDMVKSRMQISHSHPERSMLRELMHVARFEGAFVRHLLVLYQRI